MRNYARSHFSRNENYYKWPFVISQCVCMCAIYVARASTLLTEFSYVLRLQYPFKPTHTHTNTRRVCHMHKSIMHHFEWTGTSSVPFNRFTIWRNSFIDAFTRHPSTDWYYSNKNSICHFSRSIVFVTRRGSLRRLWSAHMTRARLSQTANCKWTWQEDEEEEEDRIFVIPSKKYHHHFRSINYLFVIAFKSTEKYRCDTIQQWQRIETMKK